jgi:hypothetical protein
MSDKAYKITFSGEVMPNLEVETVKSNLVLMLDIPPEKVEQMFCGQEIVIKRFDTLAEAQLRQQKLEKAGAISHIRRSGEEQEKPKRPLKKENIVGKVVGTIRDHSRRSRNHSKFSRLFSSVIDSQKRA